MVVGMSFLFLFLSLCSAIYAASSGTPINKNVEIDLVFPQNDTYSLIAPFPIIFIIQGATLAYRFGFTFEWNITGRGASRYVYTDMGDIYSFYEHQTPPDPYIIVNSTLSQDPIAADQFQLPAGEWTLGWTYSCQECEPSGVNNLNIQTGSWSGTIDFATVAAASGGTAPDLTICPLVALQIPYVANWTTCPQIGEPTSSSTSACDMKLSEAQASSVSAEVASGATMAPTGFFPGVSSGASPTGTPGATKKNDATEEGIGSYLMGAAAGVAVIGAGFL
jgi:hypothetical protein